MNLYIPENAKQIQADIESRALHESDFLDGKRELPDDNLKTAKIICAMAKDGGVIVYGAEEEDESEVLTKATPFPVDNVELRIINIARSCIAPAPQIIVRPHRLEEDPSLGFVVVIVPKSHQAPHMVVVKGLKCFYGRDGTRNVRLDEAEVARLYRERQSTETDIAELLANRVVEVAEQQSATPDGALCVLARPVVRPTMWLDEDNTAETQLLLRALGSQLSSMLQRVSGLQSVAVANLPVVDWFPYPGGFSNQSGFAEDRPLLRVNTDNGELLSFYQHGLYTGKGRRHFDLFSTLSHTLSVVYLAALLFEKFNYFGEVDLGIRIEGTSGAVWGGVGDPLGREVLLDHSYPDDSYTRVLPRSAIGLKEGCYAAAHDLCKRLIRFLAGNDFSPFQALERLL